MRGRLEVVENKKGRWYWRRRAPNGQLAGTSLPDTYTRWTDARRGARREYPTIAEPLVRVISRRGVRSA